MEMIADAASWVLIVLGSFFLVVGALGMLRMPDVYTRMHAASVIDTLGATLLILGFAIQAGFTLIALKLFFVLALLFFFGPVASHALAQAALQAGVEPLLDEDRRQREVPGKPLPVGAEATGDESKS
jgi:multicomponent Na+:H+ antiporter subunit G